MILKIFFLILVIPVLIIATMTVTYFIPLPGILEDSRELIGAITSGIVSFLYLVFLAIYTIYSFRKAGRKFDRVLSGYGLTKKSFRYFGKSYSGIIKSRRVAVEYFPPRAIQKALLNIYLYGDIKLKAVVSRGKPVQDAREYSETSVDPGYGFNVYTKNSDKIQGLFTNERFIEVLGCILRNCKGRQTLQVYFQEKRIYLRCRFSEILDEDLKIYMDSLEVLAEIIENK